MKILFITHYDNMYGANKALLNLIEGLVKNGGFEPMLVIPGKGDMTNRMEELGVPYIICGVTQWQAPYSDPLRFAIKKSLRRKKIKEETDYLYDTLKEERIDVIHSNSGVIGHGAMLAKRLGCRHIWHIREFSKEHFGMKYFYSSKTVADYYNSAYRLIAISDSVKDNYKNKYPLSKIIRIYDGVDASDFVDEKTDKQKENGIFRFIYVGYLYEKKHQLEVLKAADALLKKTDKKFELYIVGDGKKNYKKKLEDYINKNNLKNVFLTGYRDDIRDMLKTMYVGIIASEYEGFGLVTVEYMLSSLTVIGYNHSGTGEIVKNKETGLLYDDENGLIQTMEYCLNNREEIKLLGISGRKRAKEMFTSEKNTDEIISMYKELLS